MNQYNYYVQPPITFHFVMLCIVSKFIKCITFHIANGISDSLYLYKDFLDLIYTVVWV